MPVAETTTALYLEKRAHWKGSSKIIQARLVCVKVMLVKTRGVLRQAGAGWQCRNAMDPWRHRASPQVVGARLRDFMWLQLVPLDKKLFTSASRGIAIWPITVRHREHIWVPLPLLVSTNLLQGNLHGEMSLEHPLLYSQWILRAIPKGRYMFIHLINSIQKSGESVAFKRENQCSSTKTKKSCIIRPNLSSCSPCSPLKAQSYLLLHGKEQGTVPQSL